MSPCKNCKEEQKYLRCRACPWKDIYIGQLSENKKVAE